MSRLHAVIAASLVLVSLVTVREAAAQTRSSFTRTIRDEAGAALPGVQVTLASPADPGRERATPTNNRGV